MFHLFYSFSRKAGMERAAFFHHYLAVHTRAGRPVSYIKHYLQNHRIYAIDSDSIYDAATEIWSEELISNRAAAEDPDAAARVADEHNFIDGGRTERLLTTDHVMLAGSQRTGMIQATFQLRRTPGWTVDEFRRHWAEVHAPVTLKVPGIRHYQQAVTVDEAYDYAVPKTDGPGTDMVRRCRVGTNRTGIERIPPPVFTQLTAVRRGQFPILCRGTTAGLAGQGPGAGRRGNQASR